MDRSIARAHAMKLIYEWEMGGDGGEETKLNLLEITPEDKEDKYLNTVVQGVMEESAAVDALITEFLRGWTIERLSRVDLAILRLGAYELKHETAPAPVVVNEAVELAKAYSTEKAGNFVNGVLGNMARKLRD